MKKRYWLVTMMVTILLVPNFAEANKIKKRKQQCVKTKEKIEKIQKKMRGGYSLKKGRKYQDKLHELYKDEFKYCL
ncbi:hypothetical protein ABT56_19465 [Photobacterium aquae]|uniref:Uncharacterized protein n=2 Tax=Photobacterium aquae TaxID=1195763 RepID=A0A0J1GUA0_9GAMM|nr:hypothetical protein ABT56_19465 [Photobacterium aquae]